MTEPTYRRGNVSLWLGDCREILPTLDRESVDAVIADPMYGISVPGSVSVCPDGSTRNLDFFEGDHIDAAADQLRAALPTLKRPGNVFVFCGHEQFGGLVSMLTAEGMTTRPFAWVKTCPPPAGPGARWTSGFELAVFGFDDGACFTDAVAEQRPNVMRVDAYRHGQPGKVAHPTQKPLVVMHEIVKRLVPVGGVALDFCMGSGSTGVAAIREGRKFVGIEIDSAYFDVAVRRIDAELAQGKLFEANEPMEIVS